MFSCEYLLPILLSKQSPIITSLSPGGFYDISQIQVAVLDMSSMSIIFFSDSMSSSSSPIISMSWTDSIHNHSHVRNSDHSERNDSAIAAEDVFCVLLKNAKLIFIEGGTGKIINSRPWHSKEDAVAISMYILGKHIIVQLKKSDIVYLM